jgi:PHD/YefM family antitoxin component YafN of YafNO toxin-antitoxin module
MAAGRFVGADELKQRSTHLIRDISASGETCYITEDGKAKAVLMDINRYNALMDLVEEQESFREHHVGDDTRKHASVRMIMQPGSRFSSRRRRR